jgi:hypothetical protein
MPNTSSRPLALIPLIGAVAVIAVGAIAGGHVDALQAAGAFNGKGAAIAGIDQFAQHIKGNLLWAFSVLAILAVLGIGGMFLTGHTRAQDHALRAFWGFLIVAGSTGIVA